MLVLEQLSPAMAGPYDGMPASRIQISQLELPRGWPLMYWSAGALQSAYSACGGFQAGGAVVVGGLVTVVVGGGSAVVAVVVGVGAVVGAAVVVELVVGAGDVDVDAVVGAGVAVIVVVGAGPAVVVVPDGGAAATASASRPSHTAGGDASQSISAPLVLGLHGMMAATGTTRVAHWPRVMPSQASACAARAPGTSFWGSPNGAPMHCPL
jgi:hypothetical protein